MAEGLQGLARRLRQLDGRGYKAYKDIRGLYEDQGLSLRVDHVQGDPFAEPSRCIASVAADVAQFPQWTFSTVGRRVSTAGFLNRRMARLFARGSGIGGSGKSGTLRVLGAGQQALQRSSLLIADYGSPRVRFKVGLPANGRRVLGHAAAELLTEVVVDRVRTGLIFDPVDEKSLRQHIHTIEDAQALRQQLGDRQLVSFIADGSILPRRSGVDPGPLHSGKAIAFSSPPELSVSLRAPNAGEVRGMGVPAGVTLIVGGGYHGKSTLLRAIEQGVYDHIPGDGREFVVSRADAVKIRAEDGRSVAGVDISNFIGDLPSGEATERFSTANASGSTSQAAAISEALEMNAGCLLLDEDTSATNFMIRDARMQRLIAAEDEPITPFIDRVSQLRERGISIVLVIGGSGDYFDVADHVVSMRDYLASDVTTTAKEVATSTPTHREPTRKELRQVARRAPIPESIDPSRGRRDVNLKTLTDDRAVFGREEIDLSAIEQIVERSQIRAMSVALVWARDQILDANTDVASALSRVQAKVAADGLDSLQSWTDGELAAFRSFELGAFLNRIRSLEVNNPGAPST